MRICVWLVVAAAVASAAPGEEPGQGPSEPGTSASVVEAVEVPLLERQVAEEMERLRMLEEKLRTISSEAEVARTERAASPATPPPQKADTPALPSEPLAGAEEAFANTLYSLGEWKRASAVYESILKSSPNPDTAAWAKLQIGHCARKTGDYIAAVAAYEQATNMASESCWTKEAAWWCGHLKWSLLLAESMRHDAASAPNPDTTPQAPKAKQ